MNPSDSWGAFSGVWSGFKRGQKIRSKRKSASWWPYRRKRLRPLSTSPTISFGIYSSTALVRSFGWWFGCHSIETRGLVSTPSSVVSLAAEDVDHCRIFTVTHRLLLSFARHLNFLIYLLNSTLFDGGVTVIVYPKFSCCMVSSLAGIRRRLPDFCHYASTISLFPKAFRLLWYLYRIVCCLVVVGLS